MSVPLRRTPSKRPRRKPLAGEAWMDGILADAIERGDLPGASTVSPMLTPETKRALAKAGRLAKKAIEDRDALIRQACEEGGSYREVGEAVGLSHNAVAFIVRGRKAK